MTRASSTGHRPLGLNNPNHNVVMRYLIQQSLAVSFHAGQALHHPGGLGFLTVVELEPHRQHLVPLRRAVSQGV